MPCAYRDCQFPNEPTRFECDERRWCQFHLPMEDKNGAATEKATWPNHNYDVFEERIFTRIRKATEDEIADFQGVVFPRTISFANLDNEFKVGFSKACFNGLCDFSSIMFGLETDFSGAVFTGGAVFTKAKFKGYVNFANVKFQDRADFQNADFADAVTFVGATFVRYAWFHGTNFKYAAEFDHTNFESGAYFGTAKFNADAIFLAAEFWDETDFSDSDFGGFVGFELARFRSFANFSVSAKRNDASPVGTFDFSYSVISSDITFANREFGDSTEFSGAIFQGVPDFHNAKLHQDTDFRNTNFQFVRGHDDEETSRGERAYRTLKLAMEEKRSRVEEADFFAKEMECRRNRSDVPWYERSMATLYKYGSDYGRSFIRPVICIALSLLIFFLPYMELIRVHERSCHSHDKTIELRQYAADITVFEFQQIVRPFEVWSTRYRTPDTLMKRPVECAPTWVRFWATLQSLITIGLLTLFVLAVRRRFRMV